MTTVSITKIFEFEMAHALWGYDGPCKNIHGHSYKLFVTVSGKIKEGSSASKDAMVMDFSEIKKIVTEKIISLYDHALVLDENIPSEFKKAAERMSKKIVYIQGMPTCEMLVIKFAGMLKNDFPSHIKLKTLKLQETATSYAEWYMGER